MTIIIWLQKQHEDSVYTTIMYYDTTTVVYGSNSYTSHQSTGNISSHNTAGFVYNIPGEPLSTSFSWD